MRYIFTIILFTGTIYSQISLLQSDALLCNAVGTSSVSYFDSSISTIDIGNSGESSWDFSSLTPAWSYTTTVIDPSTSPYHSSFPNSSICRSYTNSVMGFQSNNWIYNSMTADGFYLDGNVTSTNVIFTITNTTTYNDPEEQLRFPLTFGTSWSQDNTYTTVTSTGGPSVTTSVHTSYIVDAYGPVAFPGGETAEALRMKRDETAVTNSQSTRTIGYIFYTKSGNSISISAADTLQPDNGIINVHGAGWVIGNITGIGVNGIENPADFRLEQNYPNPFNPSTFISFSIHKAAHVSLKIYDILGKEIAAIIDEERPAGRNVIRFKASNLSSGTYFYRLHSGSYSEIKKMVVLK